MVGIQIYADGADLESVERLANSVDGFTTNPSLCRAVGVADYLVFAKKALHLAGDKPVSLEVFADDFENMERQARQIASLAPNAVVKIPVTNSLGEFTGPVIERLSADGIALNITAIFTTGQVFRTVKALKSPAILSVFAGRIADTGRDPEFHVRVAVHARGDNKVLWASVREPFNVVQAQRSCADIITVPVAMLPKLRAFGRDLDDYSLETVQQFKKDAEGFEL